MNNRELVQQAFEDGERESFVDRDDEPTQFQSCSDLVQVWYDLDPPRPR